MHSRTFRILIVEDDPVQTKLAMAVLAGHGFHEIATATTAVDGFARAAAADLVLLDVQLPDGSGIDVLRRLRERSSRPAVVIITAHSAEAVAIEALRLGADDYVAKDAGFIDLLPNVVERVRRTLGLRDALEAAEQEVVTAERRSAVGEMTVALHHEINNPLMAALTEVTLLREEVGLPPTLARGLDVIRTALERIRDVVKRAGEADGARRTDYLAGELRMTDLSASAPTPGMNGRAALVVPDDALRRVMTVLLRRAGFEPEPFAEWADFALRLDRPPAPSVVIIAGIDPPAGAPIGAPGTARDRPWRLVVAARPGADGPLARRADLVLPIPFDPATFGPQVVALLPQRGSGPDGLLRTTR